MTATAPAPTTAVPAHELVAELCFEHGFRDQRDVATLLTLVGVEPDPSGMISAGDALAAAAAARRFVANARSLPCPTANRRYTPPVAEAALSF